jgi:hypothetical protein
MKTKILDKYNNAEEFFNMLLKLLEELNSQKEEKKSEIIRIECDFILYFILLERDLLPNNHSLFIERINSCIVTIRYKYINLNFYPGCYNFDLFIMNFTSNYLNEGIDFMVTNEPAIVAINKESAIWRINNLRENKINSLIRDIKTVESNFSKEVDHILKS